MTLKEFQNALSEAAAEHSFIEDEDGCIRQEVTDRCPLCAVAHYLLGKDYGNDMGLEAGEALGLTHHNASSVILAADNNTNSLGRKELFAHVMKWDE